MNNENFEQAMNKILRDTGLDRMFRSPSYQYYSRQDSKDRYFYTTQKCNHKGKSRYIAGIYRYLKRKKMLKLVKRVGFAKRYKADEWARAMRDKEEKQKDPSPEKS